MRQVRAQRRDTERPERHLTHFSALAGDRYEAFAEFEILDVERDEFGQTQPAAVEEFEHRRVARLKRVRGLEVQQLSREVRVQHPRQLAP